MNSVSSALSLFLLQILWRINLLYDKYFGREESIKVLSSAATVNSIAETRKLKIEFNPTHRCSTYIGQLQVMTPIEEEMLKYSCAKGRSDADSFFQKLRGYGNETHIPRSMFTVMWIDSCVR